MGALAGSHEGVVDVHGQRHPALAHQLPHPQRSLPVSLHAEHTTTTLSPTALPPCFSQFSWPPCCLKSLYIASVADEPKPPRWHWQPFMSLHAFPMSHHTFLSNAQTLADSPQQGRYRYYDTDLKAAMRPQ